MASNLGMGTLAEGLESPKQLAFFRTRGFDDIQGYHFSRPLLPEMFEPFVRKQSGNSADRSSVLLPAQYIHYIKDS